MVMRKVLFKGGLSLNTNDVTGFIVLCRIKAGNIWKSPSKLCVYIYSSSSMRFHSSVSTRHGKKIKFGMIIENPKFKVIFLL